MTGQRRLPLAGVLVLVLALPAFVAPLSASASTAAWVNTGGDCLRMRVAPGLSSEDIRCLPHGEEIVLLGPSEDRDGFTWREIEHDGRTGWVAAPYITTNPADIAQLHEPAAETAGGMIEPPPGGLTLGVASHTDPGSLAASLPWEVTSVWHLDRETQEMRGYTPGAPPFVNTLAAIPEGGVVFVRRAGTLESVGAVPEPTLTVAGTPNVLPAPPVGGLTKGVAGNTDPRFIIQAQSFTVESVSYFHVASQSWLIYVPGAPDAVNTLKQGHLRVDSIVILRRGPDAPAPPSSEDSDYFETSITYYFCVPGENPAGHGDMGGYCGAMANGEQVHDGAAACAPRHLGQRFMIEGDPTGRVYECKDTGGSVLQDHRDVWFMNSDDGYEWWLTVGERAYVLILRD